MINMTNYDNVTTYLVDLQNSGFAGKVDLTTIYSNFCSDISSQVGSSLMISLIVLGFITMSSYQIISYIIKHHATYSDKLWLSNLFDCAVDQEEYIITSSSYSVNLLLALLFAVSWIIMLWFYGIY